LWWDLTPTVLTNPPALPDIPYFLEDTGRPEGTGTPIAAQPGIELLIVNLTVINRSLEYLFDLYLNDHLWNHQIEDMLPFLEYLFKFHESYYVVLTHFVSQFGIENSPLLGQFETLHEEWRDTGNSLLQIYRLLERRLNINSANSRIPEQWFEHADID
jgi:hypothetical protein